MRAAGKLYQPHRSHLYQRLVIVGYSHHTVTLRYSGLTLIGSAVGLAWFQALPGSGLASLGLMLILPLALVGFVNSRENQGQQVSAVLGPPTLPSLPQ